MHEPTFWWRRAGLRSALLAPLAFVYDAAASRRMARQGAVAKIPIACVGNFTLGGAGKTPAALMLGRMLAEAGGRPFFLSRGYGGSVSGPTLVDPGGDLARHVGDEPLLLARTAPTVVAKDRAAGAALAMQHRASVIIMDDGLQNPSLAKDFTLAVVDARRGIGNARVFPAGPLRAGLDAQIAKTDALLVVGNGTGANEAEAQARRRGLPVLQGRLVPDPAAVSALRQSRVLAFAGIGVPQKFFDTLRAAGITAGECRAFADHHRFTADDAGSLLASAARGGMTLLTTEKDAARIAREPSLKLLAERAQVLPVVMMVDELAELSRLLTTKLRH